MTQAFCDSQAAGHLNAICSDVGRQKVAPGQVSVMAVEVSLWCWRSWVGDTTASETVPTQKGTAVEVMGSKSCWAGTEGMSTSLGMYTPVDQYVASLLALMGQHELTQASLQIQYL